MSRERDYVGYADHPPYADWPGNARLALNFVVNYEEGAERSVEFGDDRAEWINSDNAGASGPFGQRDFVTESHYDYGSRVGYWRLMRLFGQHRIPATIFAVGQALEKNPEVCRHMAASDHEVCAHGWRWIDYRDAAEAQERADIDRTLATITALTGKASTGWYTGRISANTRRLAASRPDLLYDSDAYDDDLPYWVNEAGRHWLVIPYTFECNDMRFASAPGFNTGDEFFHQLKDSFDVLYAEGLEQPKMMSVGLHCRLAGRPSRIAALSRFIEYATAHTDVWICRRSDIARHWYARHMPSDEV